MSTAIAPITYDKHEAVITALIASKQRYGASDLVRLTEDEMADVLRGYYLRASHEGLIILINLALRTVGVEQAQGVFEWRSGTIHAVHNVSAGTTEVKVGDLCVLSNLRAGRELLRPGDWLHTLHRDYKQKQMEQAWSVEIEMGKRREQDVSDFLKSV